MKTKILQRGLLGFPLGVFVGYAITIIISLFVADGHYSPCVPALVDEFGSEINALVFQSILCGLLGASFAAASVIWEIDSWNILKQTGVYFIIASLSILPIAYFTYWMEHSLLGFLFYFGIFVVIFIIVWIVQYCIWKSKIDGINKKMKEK